MAPRGAADDDGMLDFLDEGKSSADGGSTRWQVRRKSGKIFGPVDGPAIVALLRQGQLIGNEEISVDGHVWSPIASEATFAKEIRGAAPLSGDASASIAGAGRIAPPVMPVVGTAAVGGTRAETGPEAKSASQKVKKPGAFGSALKRRLPLIAGGVALVLVVGAGLFFGKSYFVSSKSPSRTPATDAKPAPSAAAPEKAAGSFETELNEGTFRGCEKALIEAKAAVTKDKSPAAVLNLAIVVSRLARRFKTAKAEIPATRELVEKLDANTPEGKIARAALDLAESPGKAAEVRGVLDPLAKDPRAATLYGESLLAMKSYKTAVKHLDNLLATHPNGEIAMQRAEAAHALDDRSGERVALNQALVLVPGHIRARLWLARLDAADGKVDSAQETLKEILTAPTVKGLDASDEALGHHLRGDVLAAEYHPADAAQEYTKAAELEADNVKHRTALADLLLRQHQWADAETAYEKALEKASTDPALLEGSAHALIHLAQYTKANDRIEEAKKNGARDPLVWTTLGDLQTALNHGADAHKSYTQALQLDEKSVPALVGEGLLFLKETRLDDAKARLEKAAQIGPADLAAQIALGQYRLAAGQNAEAKTAFETAVKIDAGSSDAYAGLADALGALGEAAKAKETYTKAITLQPRDIPIRERYGQLLRMVNDLPGALDQLNTALAIDAQDAHLQALIGCVQLDLGKRDDAEKTIKKALQLRDADAVAHECEGRLLALKGQPGDAIDHLKRAAELDPKNAEILYQLGRVYEQGTLVENAARTYKAAMALDPHMVDADEHLASSLNTGGQFQEAIAEFQRVVTKDPKRASAFGGLGDAQFKAGDVDGAIKSLEQAVSLDPKESNLQYLLGRAYEKKGRADDALKAYQQAVELEPTGAMPYYYLGYIYKERGDRKQALSAFQNYLKYTKESKDSDEINEEIGYLKDGQ
jgi:tetratricopeptide (TPR) repeat protein